MTNTSSPNSPSDRNEDAHMYNERADPTAILDGMNPDTVYECDSCGSEYDETVGSCPQCGSHDRTQAGERFLIRAKWTMDGATSMDEVLDKFEYRMEQIQALKDAGWEVDQQVTDDYAYLYRPLD